MPYRQNCLTSAKIVIIWLFSKRYFFASVEKIHINFSKYSAIKDMQLKIIGNNRLITILENVFWRESIRDMLPLCRHNFMGMQHLDYLIYMEN